MKNIIVGLPRSLLFYKYHVLWETFFNELNIKTVISPKTNKEIIENGKKFTVDEACLSLKIFIGHVYYLKDKVDYILIPRIVSLDKKMKLCTNFSALYDIVKNTFDVKILNYNIDVDKKEYEEDGFILLGKKLGFSKNSVIDAYKIAKKEYYKQNKIKYLLEEEKLKTNKIKVLLSAHAYNLNDNMIGQIIKEILSELDVVVVDGDVFNPDEDKNLYKTVSKRLYFTYNQQIINTILSFQKSIDGIILLSTFPCGPDSLVNEMIKRKIRKPIINILMDDLYSKEGIQTRIESFIDIIKKEDFYEKNN